MAWRRVSGMCDGIIIAGSRSSVRPRLAQRRRLRERVGGTEKLLVRDWSGRSAFADMTFLAGFGSACGSLRAVSELWVWVEWKKILNVFEETSLLLLLLLQ